MQKVHGIIILGNLTAPYSSIISLYSQGVNYIFHVNIINLNIILRTLCKRSVFIFCICNQFSSRFFFLYR